MFCKNMAMLRMAQRCQTGVSNILLLRHYASTADEVTFEITKAYQAHNLDEMPNSSVTLTRDDALKYYKDMLIVRQIESASLKLYQQRAIRGFCHLYTGQEAICVGIEAGIRKSDAVITSYRGHGWTYTRGASVHSVIAELLGKRTGVSKGKGGSMHMYTKNFYGGNGIVGAQVPLGAGIALAQKYSGSDNICVALYGDGAANQGQVFEAFNLSKLWGLPIIFLCENNGYGMGTTVARHSANTEYYKRGDYIPGLWLDAMDILAVREATRWAAEYCRSGKGPLVMECATYRYSGHSVTDSGIGYRPAEEVKQIKQKQDSITGLKKRMISSGLSDAEETKKMEKEVKGIVDEAVEKAIADPEIGLEALCLDVYKDIPKGFEIRGCDAFSYVQLTQ